MKLVFLFEQEIYPKFYKSELDPDEIFEFTAYDFGPFSAKLFEYVAMLEAYGLIESRESAPGLIDEADLAASDALLEVESEAHDGDVLVSRDLTFSISDRGVRFLSEVVLPTLSSAQRAALDNLKVQVLSVSLRDLLRYVYSKYPEYAEKSRIRSEILGL